MVRGVALTRNLGSKTCDRSYEAPNPTKMAMLAECVVIRSMTRATNQIPRGLSLKGGGDGWEREGVEIHCFSKAARRKQTLVLDFTLQHDDQQLRTMSFEAQAGFCS